MPGEEALCFNEEDFVVLSITDVGVVGDLLMSIQFLLKNEIGADNQWFVYYRFSESKRIWKPALYIVDQLNRFFLLDLVIIWIKYCITHYFRGRKFSRKVNLKYFREKIFSRIYFSRENNFPRKYFPAKIISRENIFSRKYFPAKIFSVPQICRLVVLGYAV